jgi:TPR repeat protein
VALLKAAADRNEPYAAYRLGQRYEKGEGVPQDDREALIYYSKASQRGFRQAREAADRIEAKQKKAGGPFEITGLRYPPWVIAAGFPGELRVAFIGLPNYPVKLVLTAGACPAGQSCPPIVHQVAAADAAGEIVVQDAIDCAGFAAAWKPDYTLTLEDSTGQQTTPKRLRTVCYPDEASQKAAQ